MENLEWMQNTPQSHLAFEAAAFFGRRWKKEHPESDPRGEEGVRPYPRAIGLILGTGWGDVLRIDHTSEIPFEEIPGFTVLAPLPGHARRVAVGTVAGKRVVVLRGRVHLNEASGDPSILTSVRLQTEMLLQYGCRTIIATSAVGSLTPPKLDGWISVGPPAMEVGSICIVDGFVTLFAPDMPLAAGEFCSPEDVLDETLQKIAFEERGPLNVRRGGYAMVRGPFFEGRKYDKRVLARTGASVVGMSMLPEACITALYKRVVACMLGLGFVTNSDSEEHSHEENLARAQKASEHLGAYLERIIARF